MLYQHDSHTSASRSFGLSLLAICAGILALPTVVLAQTPASVAVSVVADSAGGPAIPMGFRWILQEDATYEPIPGTPAADSHALNMHKSYMPVIASGTSASASTSVMVPDGTGRYYLSVLPDQPNGVDCQVVGECFTMSGKQISAGQTAVQVVVNSQPVPTAQVFLRAYEDNAPINNAWDTGEAGLGGFAVFIYDNGGQLLTDVYGNPLGTVYNDFVTPGQAPSIKRMGDGTLHTMTAEEAGDPVRNPYGLDVGEALIKNIAPAKYGIRIVPPYQPEGEKWQQTSTLEGTPGIDVWVKAGEPRFFAEFGPAGHHVETGFVRPQNFYNFGPGNNQPLEGTGTGGITGTVVNLRLSRAPDYSFNPGAPLPGCWVGLNDATGTQGMHVEPCDGDSNFSIDNIPAGDYQLVVFDTYLNLIFNLQTVTVADGAVTDMGDVETFRWFGTVENYFYLDANENGIRDLDPVTGEPLEAGVPDLALNFRYRDGSIYAANASDLEGAFPLEEAFPFFSWLVAESDYARLSPTGLTVTVDAGGPVDNGPIGQGVLNPQIQPADGGDPLDPNIFGSNCGPTGCLTRTEIGPSLTEGYNIFLGQTIRFEWGRRPWGDEVSRNTDLNGDGVLQASVKENGGISGVVYYATTRAENDPRFAAVEPWEPGIPRVQVNLYRADSTGAIADLNGSGSVELADTDNYPFCWTDPAADTDNCGATAAMGVEDVNKNNLGGDAGNCATTLSCVFDGGDAVEITATDSWDDNLPTSCPAGNPSAANPNPASDPFYLNGRCYDGLRNFTQARPAVFDGGFGFGLPFSDQYLAPGFYVIETNAPPGYVQLKEEDKNVDFGDTFTVNPLALPAQCVGTPRTVPNELALFPGIATEAAGQVTPLCDRKLVQHSDGKNTAADFFLFTETPIGGHIQGFVLNDVANEFDPLNPNFGEKFAPSFIPVSVRDFAGNEVYHTTTDAYGVYNAIVPSTYTMNIPMASGVSPNMLQVCLNSPMMEDPANPGELIPEPNFNKQYTQFCYTLNFNPGTTTYLDTPVLPVAAYTGPNNWQLDGELPDLTPMIYSASVESNGIGGGPYVAPGATGSNRTITLVSRGTVNVPDPNGTRIDGNNQTLIPRDYGFGANQGAGSVTIGGVDLTITSWSNDIIVAEIPADATTGQLQIVRDADGLGDLRTSVNAVTVIVDTGAPLVTQVQPGASIQDAIDITPAGGIVLVPPGNYFESLIVTKPIQLQGWGADSTILNAGQSPSDRIARWRLAVNYLANCSFEIGLLPGQANNIASPASPCGFTPGTGLFINDEGAGILVAPRDGAFSSSRTGRVDGLMITGADQSGAIVVNGYADFLEISNNYVVNNQSTVGAGGIRIGQPSLLGGAATWTDNDNDFVNIHNNVVSQNGSLFEPGGGVGIYTGADNYRLTRNYIVGNYAQADGGGVAHYGLSANGLIADNEIILNQAFDQTAGTGGNGGGLLIAGHEPLVGGELTLTAGSGDVRVVRNHIQSNNAGSGSGGGIALRAVNGLDVLTSNQQNNWHRVDVLNNEIVNNVAGTTAGGVSLQDAVRTSLLNNTVANNDSTATTAATFGTFGAVGSLPACVGTPGTQSCPQPAGVVAWGHSPEFAAMIAGRPGSVRNAAGTYANPFMQNNIVLGNRAQFWSVTAGVGSLNLVAAPDTYQDLAVIGTAGVEQLTASYSVLTTGAVTNGNNNTFVGGDIADQTALLVNSYHNSAPGFGNTVQPDGTVTPGGEFPIDAAAALDEGGNFIDVHFGPLSPVGDYHLTATSVAIDAGMTPNAGQFPDRSPDLDLDYRPYGPDFDIGADEVAVGAPSTGSNQAPQIISPTQVFAPEPAYVGQPYSLQVVAIDPNGDQPLTYTLCRGFGGGACTANNNLPAGMSIDSNGTISWANPTAGGSPLYRIRVADPDGAFDQQVFILAVTAANAPTANDDLYSVNTQSQFSVGAPGVMGNDSNPPQFLYGARVASLVTNLNQGGTVGLQPDGSFAYTPEPSFVGSATFTYLASNSSGSSAPATVTIVRDIAVTDARFVAALGTWSFEGFGIPGEILSFDVNGDGSGPIGSITVASDGSWRFSIPGAQPAPGTTLTISSNAGGQVLNVALYSVTAGNAPLSTSYVQCPGDTDGDAVIDVVDPTRQVTCRHLAAGDGFARMADGTELYAFGFNDVTGTPANLAIDKGLLNAQFPAPTLEFNEGDEAYVTLTNVGMLKRPDLFDPHTIHFHGFPNAASVFDGVPDSSIAINMGFSLTYYYNVVEPGTFMYHCHVEATEHMQMGMLGNLYVHPAQNGTTLGGYDTFVYNDGDGSTGYDVEVPIQIGSFDSRFHNASLAVQPLPFAEMHDDYPLLNGRGYPDTANPNPVPVVAGGEKETSGVTSATESSQKLATVIEATAGQRILLRISNLNVTQFYTLATTGLPMQVIGTGAHILRGPDEQALYYETNSVTLGGGESADVLIDTDGVTPGTYLLYSTNLNELSNGTEDFGGMMTTIVIN